MRRRAPASILALATLVAVVLVTASSAHADRRDEAWRRGNEAYLHGDYAAAAAAYEELEHQGVVSADLFFNLGDAYFRKGASHAATLPTSAIPARGYRKPEPAAGLTPSAVLLRLAFPFYVCLS